MEELELFLASHQEVNNIVILVGNCKPERIEEVFKYTAVRRCYIVCPWTTRDIELLEEKIRNDSAMGVFAAPRELIFLPLYKFKGLEQPWALCPIRCKGKELLSILEYKPLYLVGSVEETSISIFNIWERCKSYCRVINLKGWRSNDTTTLLDWEKQEDTQVELSVIFPVYNVAAYIEKCIKSVIAWKNDYTEYIFVSDGSTDESVDIIKKWMTHDSRIKLIEKENGGCASARQVGLDYATGRYVGFIDPDDFVDENMYRKLLKAAMCGNYDISLCGYNEYYENTGKIKPADDSLWHPYIEGCYDSDKINELITYCRVAIWRGIYKREFIRKNKLGFYTDLRRFDDLPFKVETFAYANSVIMIPEYLYYYRLEREGQDVAADDERLYVHFDIFTHLNKSLGSMKNQQIIDNLQMCKIQTHRYALCKIREEYRQEYLKRAREDLNSLCDYKRTYKIANIMLGSEVADEYSKIMRG